MIDREDQVKVVSADEVLVRDAWGFVADAGGACRLSWRGVLSAPVCDDPERRSIDSSLVEAGFGYEPDFVAVFDGPGGNPGFRYAYSLVTDTGFSRVLLPVEAWHRGVVELFAFGARPFAAWEVYESDSLGGVLTRLDWYLRDKFGRGIVAFETALFYYQPPASDVAGCLGFRLWWQQRSAEIISDDQALDDLPVSVPPISALGEVRFGFVEDL